MSETSGTNGGLPDSLSLALAVYQAPSQFPELLHGKADLPDGLEWLLRLAGGATPPAGVTLPPFSTLEDVREAALFFIEQVLLTHDASHYRVLGVRPTATLDEIKEHHRLLMRLFHPDRRVLAMADERKAAYATRINLAYTTLHQLTTRSAYDASLRQARQASIQMPQMRPTPRRRHYTTQPAEPLLSPGVARRLPQLVLGGFALLAMLAVAVVYLNRAPTGAIGMGDDFVQTSDAAPSSTATSVALQHADPQRAHLKTLAAAWSDETAPGIALDDLPTPATLAATNATPIPAAAEAVAPAAAPAPSVIPAIPAPAAPMAATSPPAPLPSSPSPSSLPPAPAKPTLAALKPAASTPDSTTLRPAPAKPAPKSALVIVQPLAPSLVSSAVPLPAVARVESSSPPAALATAKTDPPPTAAPEPPPRIDNSKENLATLLATFALLYEQGDLEAFLALFEDNARSESGDKTRIRSDYDVLFRTTAARKLSISDMNWVLDGQIYRGQGIFQAKVRPKGAQANQRTYDGIITLEVVNRPTPAMPLIRKIIHKTG